MLQKLFINNRLMAFILVYVSTNYYLILAYIHIHLQFLFGAFISDKNYSVTSYSNVQ